MRDCAGAGGARLPAKVGTTWTPVAGAAGRRDRRTALICSPARPTAGRPVLPAAVLEPGAVESGDWSAGVGSTGAGRLAAGVESHSLDWFFTSASVLSAVPYYPCLLGGLWAGRLGQGPWWAGP
jgi:hypothetical protein